MARLKGSRGQGCTGCNHSHSQASGSQACSHAAGHGAAHRKDQGAPSLAQSSATAEDLWPAVPPWGTGAGPQEGPCSGVGWKSQCFGTLLPLAAPPRRCLQKGPLTPPPLRSGLPGPSPPGPPVTAWSFLGTAAPALWKLWKAWEVSVVEGEMLPQIVEMDQAEADAPPDSRDGPGRGGFASAVFMGKPRPRGPESVMGLGLGWAPAGWT